MDLFVPIAGTLGADSQPPERVWWYRSLWLSFMCGEGFAPIDGADPFYWSTDLTRRAWVSGGLSLIWYLTAKMDRFEGQPLRLITHSHGIQVAAYAAHFGLEIETLIAISPPYRSNLAPQYAALRAQTKHFLTIHAKEFDEWAISGSWWGGTIPPYPPVFDADMRDVIPGIGHSNVIYDPAFFHLWRDLGWASLLRSDAWQSIEHSRQTKLPAPLNLARGSAETFNRRRR